MLTLDINDIKSEGNVRVETGDVSTLAASIDRFGLISPLLVTVTEDGDPFSGYVLVAGHRRLAAVKELGWENVPCMVDEHMTNASDIISVQYAENMERETLTAFEQAQVAWDLKLEGLTQPQVATAMGLSKKDVSEYQKVAKNLLADDDLDPVRASRWTGAALFDIASEGDTRPSEIIRLVVDEDKQVWTAVSQLEKDRQAVVFYEELEPKLIEWKEQGIETTSDAPKGAWWRVDEGAAEYLIDILRVKLADHIELDCHIITISDGQGYSVPSITHWCRRPKSHMKEEATVQPPDAKAKREASEARSVESKANRAAKQERRDLVHGWKPKRTDIRQMGFEAFVKDSWREDQVRLACQLEDLSKERQKGADYGWYGKRLAQWFEDKKMSDEAITAYKAKIILGWRYVEKQFPSEGVVDGIEAKK